MRKQCIRNGAIAALTGVMLGAFGAHGLKGQLSPELLDAYKTGVQYQLWHALGLMLIALLPTASSASLLVWAGRFMTGGIILFSGSLYVLAVTGIKWSGIITPFGGLAFMLAWLLVILYALKLPD